MGTPSIDRVFARLEWQGDCLVWMGASTARGYGVIRESDPRRMEGTHRVVYRDTMGELPEGWYVCHRCDNPPCCNPDHLFLGLPKDNTDDMVSKGRSRFGGTFKQECRRGHPFSPENTYIFPDGRRLCRTCHRVAQARVNKKRRNKIRSKG